MQLSAVFLPWGHLQKGFPVSCRLCAGVPFGNVEGQNYFQRNSVSAVNPVNENLGSQLSHFFCGNVYGGQHGREILGGFDVIHTNDRNIFRNPVSFFPDGFDGPDGSIVIGTENGRMSPVARGRTCAGHYALRAIRQAALRSFCKAALCWIRPRFS